MIAFNRQTIAQVRYVFSHSQYIDHFPPEILSLIYDQKLFKIFIPKKFNGLEADLEAGVRLIEKCAYIDGDFGWAVQIGSGGGYFAGFFQEDIAQKYFSEKHFVIAGSGSPTGKAESYNGKYKVNGQWKYCSGSHYATLFTANCTLLPTEKIKAFAFVPDQVSIIHDWDAYGMENTLSHSIAVSEAMVDEKMTFDLEHLVNDYGYKLYYFPFMEFARACIVSTLMGCFRHLLDEADHYLKHGVLAEEKANNLSNLLAILYPENTALSSSFYSKAAAAWTETGLNPGNETTAYSELSSAIDDLIGFINLSAYRIFDAAGMEATRKGGTINKIWRDLTTASQHMLMKTYSTAKE